jgi:hypothetical protein
MQYLERNHHPHQGGNLLVEKTVGSLVHVKFAVGINCTVKIHIYKPCSYFLLISNYFWMLLSTFGVSSSERSISLLPGSSYSHV